MLAQLTGMVMTYRPHCHQQIAAVATRQSPPEVGSSVARSSSASPLSSAPDSLTC